MLPDAGTVWIAVTPEHSPSTRRMLADVRVMYRDCDVAGDLRFVTLR